MNIPRKSAQFDDEQWKQIELARARLRAYKLKIQPYPLGDVPPDCRRPLESAAGLSPPIKRLDKLHGELMRLSDTFNKHIKSKKEALTIEPLISLETLDATRQSLETLENSQNL